MIDGLTNEELIYYLENDDGESDGLIQMRDIDEEVGGVIYDKKAIREMIIERLRESK